MSSAPNRNWLRDPGHFLALGGGSGLAPFAPGTFGSVVGVGLYLALTPLPLVAYVAATVALLLIGVPLCGRTARALGVHDHPAIVWDEVAAMPVVLAGVGHSPIGLVLGFALFRLFDIWKPWPIRWADRSVIGGVGIMLDDLLAAFCAAGMLAVIRQFLYF